jgi:hypothetical protein
MPRCRWAGGSVELEYPGDLYDVVGNLEIAAELSVWP